MTISACGGLGSRRPSWSVSSTTTKTQTSGKIFWCTEKIFPSIKIFQVIKIFYDCYGYHKIENFQSHKNILMCGKWFPGTSPSCHLNLQYFAFIELKHTSRTIVGVQSPRLRQRRHSHLKLKNIWITITPKNISAPLWLHSTGMRLTRTCWGPPPSTPPAPCGAWRPARWVSDKYTISTHYI